MRQGREGKRYAFLALFAALLLALGVLAAGCGGGDGDEEGAQTDTAAAGEAPAAGDLIKIGHLSNCEGPFAPFYDQTTGGAMLPLVNRGAKPENPDKPSDGITNATLAGHPVEVVWGCSDSTPDKAVEEARRLVEQEQVDILVGPLSGSEVIAIDKYSK